MRDICSFVVKVYRLKGDQMFGTVQDVESGRMVPFGSNDELWSTIGRVASRSASSPAPHQAAGMEHSKDSFISGSTRNDEED